MAALTPNFTLGRRLIRSNTSDGWWASDFTLEYLLNVVRERLTPLFRPSPQFPVEPVGYVSDL